MYFYRYKLLKKRNYYIKTLIIISALALVGLICIQSYWMINGIEQQKKHHQNIIKLSLAEIAKEVEKHETIKKAERSSGLIQPLNPTNSDPYLTNQITEILKLQDSLIKENKLQISEQNVQRNLQLKNLFKDFTSIVFTETIKDRISKKDFEKILSETLIKNEVFTDYVYSIFNENGEYQYANTDDINQLKSLSTSDYVIELFPNDFFKSNISLHLFFPKEDQFIFQSMWVLLLLSIVFLLIIIGAFYFNISTIYKQKKISTIKTDFINNMTHELKTPISTISLACEALNDEDLSNSVEKRNRFINTIAEENKRIGSLVENVLQSAVIEKEDLELKIELLDLNTIIKKAIKNIELQLNKKNGEISLDLKANNTLIEADKIHITNVIYNLLDNAIKYAKGSPVVKIESSDVINGVIIKIKDNGIGIAKEHQLKIFEKLYRVPTGDIHNVKGFGLGLSYVKSIIEKLKGNIKVESNLGDGSTFIIELIAAKQTIQ